MSTRTTSGPWPLALSFVMMLAGASPAAIVVDHASSSFAVSQDTLTWQHTVGSDTDRFLAVGLSYDGGAPGSATVTYAGIPLSIIMSLSNVNSAHVQLWGLAAPPIGIADVVVTLSTTKDFVGGAVSLFGVDQTTPYEGQSATTGSGTPAGITGISALGDVRIVVAAVDGGPVLTPISGQAEQWNTGPVSVTGATGTLPGTGGSVTMQWDFTGNDKWVVTTASFKPSGSPLDSDGDGLWDIEEDANTDADNDPATNPAPDTDGDTFPNYLDADDDGDATPTAVENANPNGDGDPRDAIDSDRDGEPDWLDAPTSSSDGTVVSEQKISSTAGGLTATLDDNDRFGTSVAGIGDVDGDGINDIVVGAQWDDDGGTDRGAVHVLFLNADGTVKAEQKISDTVGGLTATLDNSDLFGVAVAGIGDVDGDGINDIAIGVLNDDDGGTNRGAVHVLFLNADGPVKAEQKISDTAGGLTATLDDSDGFGIGVAGIGDVDGDGINAIAVGAFFDDDGGTDRGAVYVLFLNGDGTVRAEQKISDTAGGLSAVLDDSDYFGNALAGIGDVDGDGIHDIAVGAELDDDGGADRGAVYLLFLNADGTVRAEQKISDTAGGLTATLDDGDYLGNALAGIGDLDGDSVKDIAVSAMFDDDGGSDRGAVHVLFLNSDGTVKTGQKISDTTGGLTAVLDDGDRFGRAVVSIGDLDGDGVIDIAAGAHTDDDGGTDRGATYVLRLSMNSPPTVIAAIPDTTVSEDNAPIADYRDLNSVFDDVKDGGALAFVIHSNDNPGLVTATIDGADSTLDLTFAAAQSGLATIVIRAIDSGTLAVDDTFVVTVTANYSISGRVFEDAVITAATGEPFNGGEGDAGVPNARVELFDATDVFQSFTTSDGLGNYTFPNLDGGAIYKIRVVAATLDAGIGALPEQTFESDGSTDYGTFGTAMGGEDALLGDTTGQSTMMGAEHWVSVSIVAADVTGVDFGFSYELVVNSNDAGQGSLRRFIENANSIGGVQASRFNIPATDPNYTANPLAYVIQPLSPLPQIIDPTTVDGTTQPDFASTPIVVVNGSQAGAGASGLRVGSGGTTVRGLVIQQFAASGIHATAIGGNTIEGNYVGTDVTGLLDRGNGAHGIHIESDSGGSTIGGAAVTQRNVISANGAHGIYLQASSTNNVFGNYIGTNKNGLPNLGNIGHGILISGGGNNTVGGAVPGERNLVSGNLGSGVAVTD